MIHYAFTRRTAAAQQAAAFSRFHINNGTIEALKWLAAFSMTLDHVNKYIAHEKYEWMFLFGRLAFPIFAFVLAYNLARPGALENGLFNRTARRLMLAGAVASIPYIAMGKTIFPGYPLNVMFELLAGVGVIWLLKQHRKWRWAAITVFIVGGLLAEFWWFGIAFMVSAWYFASAPKSSAFRKPLFWMAVILFSLSVVNQNMYAMGALPIILIASRLKLNTPRIGAFFYVYYPAHLFLFMVIPK